MTQRPRTGQRLRLPRPPPGHRPHHPFTHVHERTYLFRIRTVLCLEVYQEWAAARRSTAYTRNAFNNRECKITHFHRVVQDMLDADD
jgi:hypothetical protein